MGADGIEFPVNTLASFFYYRQQDMAALHGLGMRIIGDSGAFSADSQGAPIDRDEFFAWARRWRPNLHWVAALDVIGDAERTWRNWRASPVDLGLVPTLHYGCDPREMDRYVAEGVSLMGLGGMVRFRAEPKRLLRWCLKVMRYARDTHPHVRFHGWGVSNPELLMNLPWWSVDSSGFGAAYRFGRLALWDPATKKHRGVAMDGRQSAGVAALLRQHYGVRWDEITRSTSATRRTVIRVSIRSMQLQEAYLQQRWQVAPPPSLEGDGVGPQIHFADSAPRNWLMALTPPLGNEETAS
jgi:hypothetical protein